MSEHARLSPSAAERWLSCPASIRMEESLVGEGVHQESSYATEGTAAHELGEMKARLEFDQISERLYRRRRQAWLNTYRDWLTQDLVDEMDEHTEAYVRLLMERMAEYEHSQIMLEQRLQTGLPESWGTSDAVIVSPQHVEIIDFKYGKGIEVQAKRNPQLRLYALGALDMYGDLLGDTELVRATVHQPRLHHVLSEELTPIELKAWREQIRPRAELALTKDAPFGPSEEACRWCEASGRCKAQLEWIFSTDFDQDPETLSLQQMAETLAKVPAISSWLKAFEEAALSTAYSEGKHIPGYKVVKSGGNRSVSDPGEVKKRLIVLGHSLDDVAPRKLKGIGDLEKLLKGEKKFKEILGDLYPRGEGRPSLVPEDDSRPAISPESEAARVFSDE